MSEVVDMVVAQRIRNQFDPASDSVDQLSEALDRLSDGQLVGLLSSMLDRRATMSVVRNEVVSLLASANTVTGLRNAYLAHYALDRLKVPQVLQDAQIEASARENVLKEGVLSAKEVAELIGVRNTNPRAWASRLRGLGRLVGLDVKGKTLYPAFQFDPQARRVRPIVDKLNPALGAKDDPWGVASWWLSESGWLPEGQTPATAAAQGGQDELLERMARPAGQG